MTSIKEIVAVHLRAMGRLATVQLGEQPAIRDESLEEKTTAACNKMQRGLRARRSRASRWLFAICVVLAVGAAIWMFLLSATCANDAWIKGGVLVALVALIEGLRRLWVQKVVLDAFLSLLDGLPPREAARALESLYFGVFQRKS